MNKNDLIIGLKNAYRKWKSASYFDKFHNIDVNKLAFFEVEHNILKL